MLTHLLLPVNCFCGADNVSETSYDPNRYPSGSQNLNWDDSTTFRHVNGVTVYEQQEPDSKQSTYMVSASVHASPEDCLKVWTNTKSISFSLLHRMPAHICRVRRQIMQAPGPLAPEKLLRASYISWQRLFTGCSVMHGGPAQEPLASLPLIGINCDLQAVLHITGGSTSDPMLFQSVMIEQLADQSRVLKVCLLTCAAAAPQSCCACMLCFVSLLGNVCHTVAGAGRPSLKSLYCMSVLKSVGNAFMYKWENDCSWNHPLTHCMLLGHNV